ncbi:hypothetical protein HanIR_Chr14g0678451 [Helianthus annuus]|nr:hypothetical protein HanIR_Chr14g0678451 [Helianthus annuus]
MVSSHAVCADHKWLRVATGVATMVSVNHAKVSSRNGTRNLWSRLVLLWLRVATAWSRVITLWLRVATG